ncbi:MAG: TIGR04282 family arsenosugar biosynthesis glycosyltransferase [Gammaproteobacteria bacterium]|nr:TIGR04282 family arsenosugar biosynthesis glycosyltransferase [Gammaproteobacteria bacterium]MDE0444262.1 TIGR04282 family arsenosugar biosynthesis glycosyltransferase [Gammaproteobacteria bacterium]
MSSTTVPRRLAIFARVPTHGRVKTRLAAGVGADAALRIYEALLASTLRELAPGRGTFEPEIWVDGAIEAFARWQRRSAAIGQRESRFPLIAQCEGDLGQRMAWAFDKGVDVLVGTDIPDMTASYVEEALDALRFADLVLGPTEDGGYCLVGMNSPRPELFEGIPWGTADVLASTLHAASNLRVELLDAMWDVDDAQDLERWHTAQVQAPTRR